MRLYRPRCEYCGRFVSYEADCFVPYGCKSYDPPEPYDPISLCEKHSNELYLRYLKSFQKGSRYGDYVKSNAEKKAADECGLSWVGSNGIGTIGTKDWATAHRYIDKKEFDRLSKLPYWGHCTQCGSKRENGYCSKKECFNSYYNKVEKNYESPTRSSR